MQRLRSVGPIVALMGLWGTALPGGAVQMPPTLSVENLRWLAGCMEMRSGDRIVEEHRMDPRSLPPGAAMQTASSSKPRGTTTLKS